MLRLVAQGHEPAPEIWHALADPTRRTLLDRLARSPLTTGQLCDGVPLTRFAVMKHLSVLERAGLITWRRHGRSRVNHINVAPLRALQAAWLSPRAVRFADAALALSQPEEEQMTQPADTPRCAEIALDWDIAAPVQRVWQRLFESVDAWWPADFRAGPAGATMRFNARLGGAIREEAADGGGVVWYTVFALETHRSIDLVGNLASRYGGPAVSTLHLELLPGAAEASTVLKLTDSVVGRVGPDFGATASEGWQAIFGTGFKSLVESGG